MALLLDLPYINRLIFRYEFDPDIGPGPFDLETRSYHTIRSKPPDNQWFANTMKWLAATSGVIAILAVLAFGVALKIGLAIPPRLEDMTINGPGLQATNVNLHIFMSNQTHRELAVGAVLDGSLGFGGSLIRDQHFGTSSLSTRAEPGNHSLALIVAGRPEVIHGFTFTTKPYTTNIVAIEITGDSQNKYRFSIKQSTKPIGVL